MSETFEYDVFISHSAEDKDAARELAQRLKADGLRVWFDEWEIRAGDMIGLRVREGLERARSLLLVMSANAVTSDWVTFESQSILFSDPTNSRRRFIPLRLDDSEPQFALRQYAYIDWREKKPEQYDSLLAACRPAPAAVAGPGEAQTSRALSGRPAVIYYVSMTPDGRLFVTASADGNVRVWDVETGRCLSTFEGHEDAVLGVDITPDGRFAVSGSADATVRVWEVLTGRRVATLRGHVASVRGVAITPDARLAVSGSYDKSVRVWDVAAGRLLATLEGHTDRVYGVAVTPDGRLAVSASADATVGVWELATGNRIACLRGHASDVHGVAVTPDGRLAVSASADRTVGVWELATGKRVATLEGHTSDVYGVAITPDGRRVVSSSGDATVGVWEVTTGKRVATLEGHADYVFGVAVTEDGRLVVSGSYDKTTRVWELPPDEEAAGEEAATRYTNAKVLLVGDAGVGKSGLAMRLTEDTFRPTVSTDAAWATQLKLPHDVSTSEIEREIWVWDFAGQADYRLIHQLFMDETALAVLVFNPQSENPFEGLRQWDRDLQKAARRKFRKLLVAGRCDRGGLMVSSASVERFCGEHGFDGYLETSAYTGVGCERLREAIVNSIPWEEIPWTSSPRIFRLLKEQIVKLKDEGKVLLRMGELKQQLEMRLPGEAFTLEQLRAVVGLLAGPGVVWQLEFGDFVLLSPERVNAYAAAVIRKVRTHAEEIGVISEEDVLAGRLDYQDMRRLPEGEEQIVLRAMHQTFVNHGLCLREATESGNLLIFPSYFKRGEPEREDHPPVLVTYLFSGQLDEVYSTLVVRLRHTSAFTRYQLSRFTADFMTQLNRRVGLRMNKRADGSAEISVYFEPEVEDETKVMFVKYVHEHLKEKAQDVVRLRHYVCPHCATPVENRKTALERLERGERDIACVNCELRVPLWDLIEEKFASEETQRRVREMEERARTSIDNESRELILIGHAFAIAGEAGQLFRPAASSDWGIDGEIEFKNNKGEPSGRRVYLQLKTSSYYQHARRADGREVFTIKDPRQARYWKTQEYPVMLVARVPDGAIHWMSVTDYLDAQGERLPRQVVFDGEPFTALSVTRLRDWLFPELLDFE